MFKAKSFLGVIMHLLIMGVIVAALILGFFYFYLPSTTNHGESISVPKITGLQLADAEAVLEEQGVQPVRAAECSADLTVNAHLPER